jgi:acetyltransferase-like isoleucine patch superfamily enzyme
MFKDLEYKIRRAETPFFRALKGLLRGIFAPRPPLFPAFLKPVLRTLYYVHFGVIATTRSLLNLFYRHPLLQGRVASIGKNVQIDTLPYITGPVEVSIGNNVYLGGKIAIMSGANTEAPPRLVLGDHCMVGWNTSFTVQQEIIVEEYAIVSYDCRLADTASHPIQADLRAAGARVSSKEIRPIRIGKYAWLGNGVTIGEGAVVGPNSVVISDLPPYSLSMGNPAEIILRSYGKPSRRTPPPDTSQDPAQSVKPAS